MFSADQRLPSQRSATDSCPLPTATQAVLDTHDTLTDYYKHLRTTEEIEAALRSCGLERLEVSRGGNGVEARGRMPAAPAGREAGAGG